MDDFKPIHFTRHALNAMAERELEGHWVEAAVRSPEWREPDPYDPVVERRFRTIAEREGRILRVACVETEHEIRVLSPFFDRRAKRPK